MTKKIKNYLKYNDFSDLRLLIAYICDISKAIQWTPLQKEKIDKIKNTLRYKLKK